MSNDEDRVTVVTTDGGGGGALVAGILGALIAIAVVVWLFGGSLFSGGDRTIDVNVDLPKVEAPAAPEAPAAD